MKKLLFTLIILCISLFASSQITLQYQGVKVVQGDFSGYNYMQTGIIHLKDNVDTILMDIDGMRMSFQPFYSFKEVLRDSIIAYTHTGQLNGAPRWVFLYFNTKGNLIEIAIAKITNPISLEAFFIPEEKRIFNLY